MNFEILHVVLHNKLLQRRIICVDVDVAVVVIGAWNSKTIE
eukprot:CAMPEP_0194258468 /NCGR_PEP_ID=MMETSP0158-20130606/41404_1 /TAXON_ID=33649 /ORGANISM="Thalassionema nitzschioides, Strain L26-B" /LENGTH=40 /DNA_ID= /DNA_START= /DNA_END= /DNA_ORIENTATION=